MATTKCYQQVFTVTGFGQFPWDMLRYDGCFPAQQQDVMNMMGNEKRSVTLRRNTIGKQDPEFARWASFLWSVERDSIITRPI